jgi:hypothetical protein
VGGKKIAVKKHVVRLSAEERAQLDELIRKGKRSAQLLTKARVLLKADVSELGEGWSDSRIAAALDTTPRSRLRGPHRDRAMSAPAVALPRSSGPGAGWSRRVSRRC